MILQVIDICEHTAFTTKGPSKREKLCLRKRNNFKKEKNVAK
jgi:hypothetical protein